MMRRFLLLLLFLLPFAGFAQTPSKKKPASTVVQPARRATPQKTSATKPKSAAKPSPKKTVKAQPAAVAETKQIRQLRGERQTLKKQIQESEQLLRSTKKDVKSQLNNLAVLNTQIGQQRQYVEGIATEVSELSTNIGYLNRQLDTLRYDLTLRKNKYAKSVQYMHRNRMTQSNLLFVLSARSFREMRRRLRYVRAFAKYQREQGEIIRERELLIREREAQLRGVKVEKDQLLKEGRSQQAKLQVQQTEREKMVEELNRQQATLQATIAQQRAKAVALDAKIDQMVQAEIAKAEARRRAAEAEAKRRADAAAAEKRRREAEAKRRAEIEAQRKEAERKRQEEQRKRQEEARLRREAAAAKAAGQAREAERKRQEAERAKQDADRAATAQRQAERAARAAATKPAEPVYVAPSNADRQLSSSFEANRGRLPAPITGSYAITSRYGSYAVEGLRGVHLDNKGINLTSRSGASARAIFDGEVSAIFSYGGMYNIIVRHGSYMSVYCNLASVSVGRGQKVSTGQSLGSIAADGNGNYTLHFQLRRETARLNPEGWFR